MVYDFDPTDLGPEGPLSKLDLDDLPAIQGVPRQLDIRPDSQEAMVIGTLEGDKAFNHGGGASNASASADAAAVLGPRIRFLRAGGVIFTPGQRSSR